MSGYRIPFNRPSLVGNELQYIAEAVRQGKLSGDGEFTRRCEAELEKTLSVRKVLLTTSCTHALEMAALLVEVGPGDEVIVPTFTFPSTAGAFALRGAEIRFADVRSDTLTLDETRLEQLVTARTRAIVPVHYAGVGCEMATIGRVARRHGLAVVEDNAQGFLGKYRGRYLGTLGALATLSFHETKNVTCGEGGALLINEDRFVERAEIVREKGTDRKKFFRGQVEKYTWVDVGSSYIPSDILAAFLLAQLEARERIQERRRELWHRYYRALEGWAEQVGVRLPVVPPGCEQPYHMFFVILPSAAARQVMINRLGARGILAVFHYVPLHLSAMGKAHGGHVGDCPVAEELSERLLRLPFYCSLEDGEQDEVIEAVTTCAW